MLAFLLAAVVAAPLHIDAAADHPLAVVLRTGQPLLSPVLPEQFRDSVHAAVGACLIVPLVTRSGAAGA